MSLHPCVRYLSGGMLRTYWLAPQDLVSVDVSEAAIRHALDIARGEGGTDIRIEIYNGPDLKLRVHVPMPTMQAR